MKNGVEQTVSCRVCGRPFTALSCNAKYCPNCKEEKEKEVKAKSMRKKRAAKKRESMRSKGPTLAEIAAKAKELHMTYGEYVTRFGG